MIIWRPTNSLSYPITRLQETPTTEQQLILSKYVNEYLLIIKEGEAARRYMR